MGWIYFTNDKRSEKKNEKNYTSLSLSSHSKFNVRKEKKRSDSKITPH